MKDIIIIGAGGIGKEVACIIEQINNKKHIWNIIGFIDDNPCTWGKKINSYEVLGNLKKLNSVNYETYLIIAISDYVCKKEIVKKLENKFKFANIIHPDVYMHNTIKVGEGNIIYSGVVMTTNISIGNHVVISPKCGIGHESIIDDYSTLLWNVNISGNDFIEEGTMIGSGATIIQNKQIKTGAIIGAGAVVIADVEPYNVVAGIPARVIKKRLNQ